MRARVCVCVGEVPLFAAPTPQKPPPQPLLPHYLHLTQLWTVCPLRAGAFDARRHPSACGMTADREAVASGNMSDGSWDSHSGSVRSPKPLGRLPRITAAHVHVRAQAGRGVVWRERALGV